MNMIKEELRKIKQQYEQKLVMAKEQLETLPQGKLRTTTHKGTPYYYITMPEEIDPPIGRRYLHKDNIEIAYGLAQRDYNERIISELTRQLKAIDNCINKLEPTRLYDIFDKMPSARKCLIKQYFRSDTEYVKAWLEKEYTHKTFREGTSEIYSDRGERVRSKSEKIIADKLFRLGIPYKYEAPIILHGIGTIHPDFTILEIKSRREVYWEHFGMMENPEYAENAVERITIYEKNGIFLGEQLFATFETTKRPLEINHIERMLKRWQVTLIPDIFSI